MAVRVEEDEQVNRRAPRVSKCHRLTGSSGPWTVLDCLACYAADVEAHQPKENDKLRSHLASIQNQQQPPHHLSLTVM